MNRNVVVIGGGLAGLAAANYLARGGARVTLLERSREAGGRARTGELGGARTNLGPHALYRGGPATRVLQELGVPVAGREPRLHGAFAVRGEAAHTLPLGLGSLVTTSLLPLRAKLEVAGFLARLARIDARALAATTVGAWLATTFSTGEARQLLEALLRLSTYSSDVARTSAGASLEQLQLASRSGVLYLDGGWQSLVEGLRAKAVAAGVEVRPGSPVAAVEHDESVRGVKLASGETLAADAVVIAASPTVARDLLAAGPAASAARALTDGAIPVEAASLDLVLDTPAATLPGFALGIDRPLYLSVHSRAAKLAPEGQELVSVMKYLPPGEPTDARSDEAELERLVDLVQPGWRVRLRERRFLPRLEVVGSLVRADRGGLAGRTPVLVPGVRGLALAGDWVGSDGQLADAALASGRSAARALLADLQVGSARTREEVAA